MNNRVVGALRAAAAVVVPGYAARRAILIVALCSVPSFTLGLLMPLWTFPLVTVIVVAWSQVACELAERVYPRVGA